MVFTEMAVSCGLNWFQDVSRQQHSKETEDHLNLLEMCGLKCLEMCQMCKSSEKTCSPKSVPKAPRENQSARGHESGEHGFC